MNKIIIYKRDNLGREVQWRQFMYDYEESLYDTKEKAFIHYFWDAIIKQKYELTNECMYIRDYYEYNNNFNRLSYRGEGIYYKGKIIISLDDLRNGVKDVEIGDKLYFIE